VNDTSSYESGKYKQKIKEQTSGAALIANSDYEAETDEFEEIRDSDPIFTEESEKPDTVVPKVPEVEKDKNEDVEYSEDSF
jgi:hypothetical protein